MQKSVTIHLRLSRYGGLSPTFQAHPFLSGCTGKLFSLGRPENFKYTEHSACKIIGRVCFLLPLLDILLQVSTGILGGEIQYQSQFADQHIARRIHR